MTRLEVFFDSDYLWVGEPFSLFHHSVLIWLKCFSHASWTFLVLQKQQNLGRRFGTSKMHLSSLWRACVCWRVGLKSIAKILLLLNSISITKSFQGKVYYKDSMRLKLVRVRRTGIDTIKYHTWPRIQMGKWQTHNKTPQTRAKRSALSQQVTTKHI